MEHGLSRTIQSCAMRRKRVTTHVNRKYHLYPYTVQKLFLFAHLTIDYSITVLHSNLQYRGLWREICPAAFLDYHSFHFPWLSGSDSHMIHLCSDRSCFPLQRRHKMFGCSSSHHLTCLLSSPPVHPLHTWSMHTHPHKCTAATRSFEELSLFHPMLNHVQ